MNKVIGYDEVLRLLKEGYGIYWLSGHNAHAFISYKDNRLTIRADTLRKLYLDGFIEYPRYDSVTRLKEVNE